MKLINKISYLHLIFFGVITELALFLIQFGFLNLYVLFKPGSEMAFTTEYMKYGGIFVFQFIGFFTYLVMAYFLSKKIDKEIIQKIFFFVVIGGLVELSFYLLIMQAKYEGAYLYSIFSKFVGAAFGVIIYSIATRNAKSHDSYI